MESGLENFRIDSYVSYIFEFYTEFYTDFKGFFVVVVLFLKLKSTSEKIEN